MASADRPPGQRLAATSPRRCLRPAAERWPCCSEPTDTENARRATIPPATQAAGAGLVLSLPFHPPTNVRTADYSAHDWIASPRVFRGTALRVPRMVRQKNATQRSRRCFDLLDNLVKMIEAARRACRAAVECDADFAGAEECSKRLHAPFCMRSRPRSAARHSTTEAASSSSARSAMRAPGSASATAIRPSPSSQHHVDVRDRSQRRLFTATAGRFDGEDR